MQCQANASPLPRTPTATSHPRTRNCHPGRYNSHVHDRIAARLLRLNREFYQSFAEPFAESRGRLQPGVLHALEDVPVRASILDLGCGNGELARELDRRGHRGAYLGLDSSPGLLKLARRGTGPERRFVQTDLADPGWTQELSSEADDGAFERVFAFSLLHHLPGAALRERVIAEVRTLLSEGGKFVFSTWNFLASQRLRRRIVRWEEIGLSASEVDEGDFLLDWRRGGYGLRYVHNFSHAELEALAWETGFSIALTYLSDGEGGRLGRYHVWEKR